MTIKNESELRAIYGFPGVRAKDKVLSKLDKHAKHFIKCSPFLVLSTTSASGKMDASPRGGEPGFVHIANAGELLIPDFKGNNRIDSLTNIVETGIVGMIFLIPGIDETLRINGRATINTSTDVTSKFAVGSVEPRSCIVVAVQEIFLHCAKALMRSKLWTNEYRIEAGDFPTMGEMLKDHLGSPGEPESREDMLKRYQPDL